MFLESNGEKFWSHSFHLSNSGILQTRKDQRGDPTKMNFDIFQIQKWIMNITKELIKQMKKWVICLVPFFSSSVMVLKLPKIVHLLQICADFTKKSRSIKAICLYLSERPHQAYLENCSFIGVWATVHKILRNKISKKELALQKFDEISQLQALISSKL